MSERRGKTRVWFAREAQFTRDEKIETLGHEFGPGGPLVVEEIFALAKLQETAGTVRVTYTLLGARAFVTPRRAKQIAFAAEAIGVLSFVEVDAAGFVAELPNYARWQVADRTNAERQARHRAKNRPRGDDGVTAPAVTSGVTPAVTGRDSNPPTQTHTGSSGGDAGAIHPRLGEVLAILEPLPGMVVEALSIESTMRGHPDVDPVLGAYRAAAKVQDSSARTSNMTALYGGVLRRMDEDRLKAERTPERRASSGQPTPAKPWAGAIRRAREQTP